MVERMLLASEVAEYTRMNVQTIYRKVKSGELPCYRSGKAIRFKLEEVEMAMKGGEKCQKSRNEVP